MRIPAVFLVSSMLLAVACGNGGTGVGTAPPNAEACPATPPKAGDACSALQVCAYPPCDDAGNCPTTTTVAYCSGGAGAKWEVSSPGDAGGFADAAIVPDTSTGDASDADAELDAADAELDAADAADVADAADAADASSDSLSDTSSDGPDSD